MAQQVGYFANHVTASPTVDVVLTPVPGAPQVMLTVTDEDPDGFKDLTHAYTLFAPSTKAGDAEKRGRFNFGCKTFATEAACRAAGVFGDGEFMTHLTSPEAAALIASRARTVRPMNVHTLAAAMIRCHSVR